MKMKFLLALMAGTIALSAQADLHNFYKCTSVDCIDELGKVARAIIKGGEEGIAMTSPKGKKIPFSVFNQNTVQNLEALEALHGRTMLINLPNATCEQLYLLSMIYENIQESKGKDSTLGALFFLGNMTKECRRTLGLY